MKIASNPIDLRIASESEKKLAETLIDEGNERVLGLAKIENPEHILVSETAFSGHLSFYMGFENENGEIESCGWIGKL